ncbi:MAG: helix-turn-helix domain-containing protein [Lachnospiraceae bacterium]|nr:helix-turn-helix domain-containing protein [Lachnospiraceae bacterium]
MKENYGFSYIGLDVKATQMRVGALIQESGLTDKEIGDYLNLSVQSINKWRHGRCLPDIENLFLLSRIFDLRVDDFLVPVISPAGEDDPKPDANTQAISKFRRLSAYYDGIRMILNHPLNDNAA